MADSTIKNQTVTNYPKPKNYILSLWFQGVSVFVTDIHRDVYKELEVIYIIDNGTFKQYFF